MADIAIHARGVSKQYRLGAPGRYTTLREHLGSLVRRPGSLMTPAARKTMWALRDVSFDVRRGEVVGIVGRNGAGKSTLLKVLSRITEPTSGTIDVHGRVGSLLEVGTGFHPELTGRENVFLNGAVLGMRRREVLARFDEIVAFAGVEAFIDTPVKHYSSGMYMRLAFAIAAHIEPEILVIDEVLAVGDAEFQRRCLGKMDEIARGGRTVLFVSHNMAAIEQLCSRALLIADGRVKQDGSVAAALAEYARSLAGPPGRSLSEAPREGAGTVRFVEFWLEDQELGVVEQVRSGRDIRMHLRLVADEGKATRNMRISIGVHDSLGATLMLLSTELVEQTPLQLESQATVVCKIPRFPLSEGLYRLTLYLETNSIIQDWLQQAVELRVDAGNFFGTGRTVPQGWQGRCVLVDHEWAIA